MVSVLVSSRCLSQICICETLYLVLLLAPVLYALSQQSALPERAAAIVYMCTLLLRSVVLLALHARVPAPAEYYSRHQAVRLFLRLLTMGSCVSVVCLLDSSSVLRGDSLPALALWCVAAVEVYLALSQLGLYALLHLFFPHAALSCLAPFMPLNAAFAAVGLAQAGQLRSLTVHAARHPRPELQLSQHALRHVLRRLHERHAGGRQSAPVHLLPRLPCRLHRQLARQTACLPALRRHRQHPPGRRRGR